ncbi:MAG: FAD-dependent oxidoreductase [Bradymonadales bacterium]|nr:FAD-dependent oxidoreductase [Bradymonadales bacterium]
MSMMKKEIVVIGGSAAGLTAAITAHRQYPDRSILLVRKEEQVVIPCGIPYIYGTVGSPKKNLIPDAPLEANGIALTVGEVVGIDTAGSKLELDNGDEIGYERLIVATGSLPAMPPIPGFDKGDIWGIYKEVPLLTELQTRLQSVNKLVIVGGGFIGIEFADECKKAGIEEVTVVEFLPHCLMLAFDEEFAVEAEKRLQDRGIRLKTGVKVARFEGETHVERVVLETGETIEADLVIMGIGAVANVKVAKESGLKLGATGAIAVDRTMKTSVPNIFACGDCAEKISFFGGVPSPLKLASIAASEARIAGANLYGIRRENIGTIGVWSTAIGEFALACGGLTESMAKKAGYDYVAGTAMGPNRHPGCMPDAENITIKLLFERRTGVLLGGQLMGSKSVGELVNVISACIQKRMTFDDIATFQIGTHPALTSSPIAYQLVNAAEMAFMKAAK